MSSEAGAPLARPRVLLVGEPTARPPGLERALTRAGFHLIEHQEGVPDPSVDIVLVTLTDVATGLAGLLPPASSRPAAEPPVFVVIGENNRNGPADALALGATDALAAPVHLPELCARLHARIRERTNAPETAEVQTSKAGFPVAEPEALDLRVRQEFERARRYSLSFSLILMDIDQLRTIEEHDGPMAAEALRQEVVQALRRELRIPDFVVSYGATEFAIVLPETGEAGARQSILRVRDRLPMVPWENDPRRDRNRFSAGIVTYPHPAVSQTDELLALAEAALVRGKVQTGDRIGMAI